MISPTSLPLLLLGLALVVVPATSSAVPGDVDSTFGAGGIVTTSFGGSEQFCTGVLTLADGRIVTTGAGAGNDGDFTFARYNPDGSLDTSFNGSGQLIVTVDPTFTDSPRAGLVLQPDGKVVAAGLIANGSLVVVRIGQNGSLDPLFDGDGIATVQTMQSSAAQGLTLQPDGRIVVAGALFTSGDALIARFNSDGTLDGSFSPISPISSGVLVLPLPGTQIASGVAVQSDGRIVAGGTSDGDFWLVRVESNGALDTSFNGAGFVQTDIGAGDDEIFDLQLQPDGRLVAAGRSGGDAILARYNPDGTLDPGFGTGGIVVTDFGGTDDYFGAIAFDSKGRIVGAGGSAGRFAVARFNADGTPDSSFDADGIRTLDVGASGTAIAVALDPDGRIVACGGNSATGDPQKVARFEGTFCETGPRSGCLTADKSLILINDRPEDDKDKLLFKWLKGTTSLAEFGNPTQDTHYALCVYDQNGVVLEAALLPGGTCGGQPCWKSVGDSGFKYKDKSAGHDGVQITKLKSGTGKAKLLLKGRGENLPDPSLPLTAPVTAQVVTSDEGTCWQAVFLASDEKKNSIGQYKAK